MVPAPPNWLTVATTAKLVEAKGVVKPIVRFPVESSPMSAMFVAVDKVDVLILGPGEPAPCLVRTVMILLGALCYCCCVVVLPAAAESVAGARSRARLLRARGGVVVVT